MQSCSHARTIAASLSSESKARLFALLPISHTPRRSVGISTCCIVESPYMSCMSPPSVSVPILSFEALVPPVTFICLFLLLSSSILDQPWFSTQRLSNTLSHEGAFSLATPVEDSHDMATFDHGPASQGELAIFLESSKRDFLTAVEAQKGLDGWVIVVGNEAGDLDSIAAAVGFAYFTASTFRDSTLRYVPLYQAASTDLSLRPENAYAFESASISPSSQILFLDDLPTPYTQLADSGAKFALVDHNRLSPVFGDAEDEGSVVAIIDHHADEGHHRSAIPRVIQVPTGSCSSLVAEHFSKQRVKEVPRSLADFLISAILIDTGNKPAPKGKAVESDIQAMEFLVPFSSFSVKEKSLVATSSVQKDSQTLLGDRTKLLQAKKFDLSALQGRDLLRRDYKEYESEQLHIRYGLSSVPLKLSEWLDRPEIGDKWEEILAKMEEWGSERDLDIVGVLTSYQVPKKGREHLHLVRERKGRGVSLQKSQAVFGELKKDETLDLAVLKGGEELQVKGGEWEGRVFAYQQGNAGATRKQVAPAMKKAIEAVEGQAKM